MDDLADPAVSSYRAVLDDAGPLAMRHEVLVTVAVTAQRVPARGRPPEERQGANRNSREAACIDALLGQLRLFVERLEGAGLLVSSPLGADELDGALASRMSHDAGTETSDAESPVSLLAHLRAWRTGRTRPTAPTQWRPESAEAKWRSWIVDGVHHRAFHVAEWPRFELPAAWMAPLMVWGSGRRTVAVVLEPVPVRASHRAIERQATKLESDRVHRESKGFRVPAHHRRASRAVAEREEELVAGFAELEYAGLVCISAPSASELERRTADLQQVAIACGLELEPLAGRHDLGVAACLPTPRGLARAWAA
ncbi:MAG: SCO6880 family protein [Acidimicrobiales bacterium]